MLVSVAALCAWTLCSTLADTGDRQSQPSGTRGDKLDLAPSRGDKLAVSTRTSNVYASLFDPRSSLDLSSASFANNSSLRRDGNPLISTPLLPPVPAVAQKGSDVLPLPSHSERVAQKVILPAPRPASAPIRNTALAESAQGNQITSDTPSAKPSIFATIFDKLFGKPTKVKLAYATADDGGLSNDQGAAGRYDQWTAVYDISAHTVYMPDGTQLEAHSGFGSLLDDPSHADEKMRGVTPPNVYDLELREELFHGVRALRLIPEDVQKVFGRAGLLAHSFMLGPNGDSNGCVSFRNYDAFLQAYLDHKVKRLAVVTSL
jgi:Protein of unknown function (DUF2778)